MSSLLKEAIIDAKALREAALKNAEIAVINKYSNEVRKTLNTLLEQEPDSLADLGLGGDEPEMDTDDTETTSVSSDQSFNDDIDEVPYAALQEHVARLNESKEEIVEVIEEDEEETIVMKEDEIEVEESVEESVDLDSLTDAIVEKLTVDMGADLAGWAGRSSDDMKYQMEKEMAHRRTTEVEEELEVLKKAQEELVFENKSLTTQISKYKNAIGELKESINDINLSNARLLYTNRVLRNTSLNERQKEQIVEAISKSDSVNEARTIFNTLQSTVQSAPKRGPQSLSEAINRPSSLIRATRKESKEPNDVFAERMKKLAGIKK